MARSQSNGALKIAGAAAAAIAGGIAIGYLVGGARTPHPAEQAQQTPAPEISRSAPAVSPSSIHPRTANGNYTAPGAPHIIISEERQPILRRVTPPAAAPKDPEATQEAPPPRPSPPPPAAVAQNSDGSTNTSASTTDSAGDPSAVGTAPKTAPASSDPDFEHIGGAAPAADSEAGQDSGSKDGSQFRVQTGAYTDESNARSVADQLRGQGYSTSTRSERVGDHLIYKVQVGAYRSKVGANKAADDLQKKGYPAYVSPIGP